MYRLHIRSCNCFSSIMNKETVLVNTGMSGTQAAQQRVESLEEDSPPSDGETASGSANFLNFSISSKLGSLPCR
jgi:hypothetical protein